MTDPRQLWAGDAEHLPSPDPNDLRRRSDRLHRTLRRRDAVEYAAAALAIVAFVFIAARSSDILVRIACGAIVVGTCVVIRNLWVRRSPAPDGAALPSIAFLRGRLVTQRDALRSVWRWYLLPPVPGMALLFVARARALAETLPLAAALAPTLLSAAVVALVFWTIHRLNLRAAARLDAQIADLDAETRSHSIQEDTR